MIKDIQWARATTSTSCLPYTAQFVTPYELGSTKVCLIASAVRDEEDLTCVGHCNIAGMHWWRAEQ